MRKQRIDRRGILESYDSSDRLSRFGDPLDDLTGLPESN